jgi:predicted metal-dependent HD superfamily phosphohydrolase
MPTDPFRVQELAEAELDQELISRWEALMPSHPELGESLRRRYAEPHRRYHDRSHLLQVLRMVDQLAGNEDLFLVRLAAWFHDAVYDLPERELSNEEASARLSVRELGRAGLEQEDLTQVARLVRLTSTHLPGTRDPKGELLCDAYVAAVRAEYAAVPEPEFLAGRLAVLQPLADGEIFRSGKAQSLKAAARENLERELWSLRDRLGLEQPDGDAVEDSPS